MLPLQSLTQHSVLEHYVLTRAIDHWVDPKYVTYNGKTSRLQSRNSRRASYVRCYT